PPDAREIPYLVQEGVDQRTAPVTGRGMHDEAGRLVDHEQVGVLVENIERYVLGRERRGFRRGDSKADAVAGGGDDAFLRHLAVEHHHAGFDQLDDAGTRERQARGEIGVEARFVTRVDRQLRPALLIVHWLPGAAPPSRAI